jgi:hypothetical protein
MEYPVYWTLIESVRCNVKEKYETYLKNATLTVEDLQMFIGYLQTIERAVEFLEKEPKIPATEE